MIDTTQTNYILADTRDEILNTQPGNGLLAISKDTSSLFVSDGNRWIETNINSKHNIEYPITSNIDISQSPVIHFDTTDTATMENATGGEVVDTQPVTRINSIVSNEAMVTPPTYAPVYIANDHNNNPGVLAFGYQGMTPDLDVAEKRDGAMTILCVYTPTKNALGLDDQGRESGLERRWDSPANVTNASNAGSNRYSLPRITGDQYIVSAFVHGEQKQCYRWKVSNASTVHYGLYGAHKTHNFPESYMTTVHDPAGVEQNGGYTHLISGVLRSDGTTPGNRIHHWNQNFIGKPQIVSIRVENNKDRSFGTMLKVQLHTFHPESLDTPYPYNVVWDSDNTNYSSIINHGLSFGTYTANHSSIYYRAHATFHEMMYFDKYLPDSDLGKLGEELVDKWDTGGGNNIWRL